MVMLWKHLALFLNQPVNDATIGMSYEWYWWSYSDGPPPSPPFSKLLGVRLCRVCLVDSNPLRHSPYCSSQ
ncbi:conserved hypothetical protein [Ricinus communis]|uniref:Uncharacterized protein n=1 Tax=Ricinus communis TaxID=3988 RepID=B9RDQ2_RICCO|nr:conserved hypothetical protein [Ricinus communis]